MLSYCFLGAGAGALALTAPLLEGFFAGAAVFFAGAIGLLLLGFAGLPALPLAAFAGAAFAGAALRAGLGALAFLVGFLDLGTGRFFVAIGPALYVGYGRTRMANLHVSSGNVAFVRADRMARTCLLGLGR